MLIPYYTRSLDAAMTLVPQSMKWHASNHTERRKPGSVPEHFHGWAGVYGKPLTGSECDTFAATPALALCAAALKAIAASQQQAEQR